MQSLKAIIFDVDGTIANTEEVHRQSFNTAFTEFGLEYQWSEQDYTNLLSISGGRERILSFLRSCNYEIRGDMDLREFALHIHQRKSEIYREKLISGHIGLRNGVARLISESKQQGIKLGIATATSLANVKTLLENNLGTNAMSLFDAVVTSDLVKDKKPSPVVYQCALAELGLTADYCIAIEDTTNGNLAALASGLKTVITTHAFTIDNDFSGANLVLDQLGEPDTPFNVIKGDTFGYRYVDVALLRRVLTNCDVEQTDLRSDNVAVLAK